ncbi:hypothetical protein [Dehalobacterium formicoaceticum]|uniref:Rubrerythrin diiron-binding domain-containing protein n=1 Tax=Dehalobacterium formicoaceticum TaxID=51515 RepID=A0ABT1Y737_9FIRM|nr:hypothetical protein [Dehalobacterium formicoaceticum]MCR6546687.1 hypothetical protein [Dehalobacterium formicoaceticum]
MHTLNHLEEILKQKEQALIQYVRYMREAQDSENQDMAALFADLAKAEEKHITVVRNQLVDMSGEGDGALNQYQRINEYNSQNSLYPTTQVH